MNFSEFCVPFYNRSQASCGLRGYSSQAAIVEFFLRTGLGNQADSILMYSEDTFRKWFKGTRVISGNIWKEVTDNFSKDQFIKVLHTVVNTSQISNMLADFGVQTANSTTEMFCNAVAEQFFTIASGNGESENVIPHFYTVTDLPIEPTVNKTLSMPDICLNTDFYHLVVTYGDIWSEKHIDVSMDRAVAGSATPEKFRKGFVECDKLFLNQLYEYPAIVCQENTQMNGITDENQRAIVAIIKRIKKSNRFVRIYFEPVATISQFLMNKYSVEFDLDNSGTLTTLNRSHWSIRETNLQEALDFTKIELIPFSAFQKDSTSVD